MRSDFSLKQYNGELLPNIKLLTQRYYHRGFKCHREVLYLQPMIPPKHFDIFPPDWGMLRRSRRVQIFLQIGSELVSAPHLEPSLVGVFFCYLFLFCFVLFLFLCSRWSFVDEDVPLIFSCRADDVLILLLILVILLPD